MSTRVLVLGATGKTGRRLMPLLVERGVTVRAASRTPTPATPGVESIRFDWSDDSTYGPALAGTDSVYLVTMQVADRVADSVSQAENLIGHAAANGVRRIVLLSAYGVEHADPADPMRHIELAVERSGVPNTVLRPAAFMQNFSEPHLFDLRARIVERDEIALPGGALPVSYVSTDDIAEVAAVTLAEDGHEGRSYTLTGPTSLTLPEVAEHISRAAGREIRHVESTPETVRAALLDAGAPPDYADYVAGFYLRYVMATSSGSMEPVTTDIATVTGRPATGFAEFATRDAAAWAIADAALQGSS